MGTLTIKKGFRSAAKEGGGLCMPLGQSEEAILRVVSSRNFVWISDIQEKIDEAFGGGIGQGGVFTTLHRLERDDYVLITKSQSLPERGGKARNKYSITAKGIEALAEQERKNDLIRSLSGNRPVTSLKTAIKTNPKP